MSRELLSGQTERILGLLEMYLSAEGEFTCILSST
jgi:hypothetical protein